jgi:hypothetical protein
MAKVSSLDAIRQGIDAQIQELKAHGAHVPTPSAEPRAEAVDAPAPIAGASASSGLAEPSHWHAPAMPPDAGFDWHDPTLAAEPQDDESSIHPIDVFGPPPPLAPPQQPDTLFPPQAPQPAPPAPAKPTEDGQQSSVWDHIAQVLDGRPVVPMPEQPAPAAASAPQRAPDQASEAESASLQAQQRLKLQTRMSFLVDLRQKLDDDPELFNFVDSMIANQVKAAERRQRRYSAIVTTGLSVVSLIAGWLLSAISPAATVAHILGH